MSHVHHGPRLAGQVRWFGDLVSGAACTFMLSVLGCCILLLIHIILSDTDIYPSRSYRDDAISLWSNAFPSLSPPIDGRESIQREWDNPQVEATQQQNLKKI